MNRAMRILSLTALLLFCPTLLLGFLAVMFGPIPPRGFSALLISAAVLFVLDFLCMFVPWVLALIDSARSRRWRWFAKIVFLGGPFMILHYAEATDRSNP